MAGQMCFSDLAGMQGGAVPLWVDRVIACGRMSAQHASRVSCSTTGMTEAERMEHERQARSGALERRQLL